MLYIGSAIYGEPAFCTLGCLHCGGVKASTEHRSPAHRSLEFRLLDYDQPNVQRHSTSTPRNRADALKFGGLFSGLSEFQVIAVSGNEVRVAVLVCRFPLST